MFRALASSRAGLALGLAARRCVIARRSYAKIPPAALAQSFQPEISALEGHSALLNQTNPADLLQLVDVVPMIRIYKSLVDRGLGDLVVRQTCRALSRTAKDATFALRTLPQSNRVDAQSTLFKNLKQYCDVVAASFVEAKVAVDRLSVGTLLSSYEIVDPFAGVTFFRAIGEAAGSAIPCMVKSGISLTEIKTAYEGETGGDPLYGRGRAAANMAWAYLRYGTVPGALEEASALMSSLMQNRERLPASVYDFVVDAFIGDAPADTALATYIEHEDHLPHHAAMSRFMARYWEANKDVDAQVKLFTSYLTRLGRTATSEMTFKSVTTEVIRNIFAGSPSPNESLGYLERIHASYDACVPTRTLFLNITLSEAIRRQWPQSEEVRDLVLTILKLYDESNDVSPVSFRVRLNALEEFTGVEEAFKVLWNARTASHMPPLNKLDWMSLVRATKGGQYFVEQWLDAGAPFERDIRRFSKSRGYRL